MEKKILSTAAVATGNTVGTAEFYPELLTVMFELRWMLLAVAALVMTDFMTGLAASVRLRGEDFRFSRAGRRTAGKLIEYFGYLIIGVTVGKGVAEPLGLCGYVQVAAVCLGFAVLWETDSIAGHVCELHGIKTRFSLKRLIVALIKRRSKDLGEAVEEELGKN